MNIGGKFCAMSDVFWQWGDRADVYACSAVAYGFGSSRFSALSHGLQEGVWGEERQLALVVGSFRHFAKRVERRFGPIVRPFPPSPYDYLGRAR